MTKKTQKLKDDPLTPEKWRKVITSSHASEFMDKYNKIYFKEYEVEILKKNLNGKLIDYTSPKRTIKNGKIIIKIGKQHQQIYNERKDFDKYSSKLIKMVFNNLQANEEDLSKILNEKCDYNRPQIYWDLENIAAGQDYNLLFCQNKKVVLSQIAYTIRKDILRKFEYKPNSDGYDRGWAILEEDVYD